MIIIDRNIWIDHLAATDQAVAVILTEMSHRVHPFVVGELALGSIRDRERVIAAMEDMPAAAVATHDEVMHLIADHALHGLGIGSVDAHLLASAKLMPGSRIWTRDRRLAAVSDRLGLSYQAVH